MTHNFIGEMAPRCTVCGVLAASLKRNPTTGKLPACPDAPTPVFDQHTEFDKQKSYKSSNSKLKNMRYRVMERNRYFYYPKNEKPGYFRCDICAEETSKPSGFVNSHIIAKSHAKLLHTARKTNLALVCTPSYVMNGLFLCRACDSHFEDHYIQILEDGTLQILPEADPRDKYQPLNGTKVAWVSMIGVGDWPGAETLKFRNTLTPVLGEHRQLQFGVASDDDVLGNADEDTEGSVTQEVLTSVVKRKADAVDVATYGVEKAEISYAKQELMGLLRACRGEVSIFLKGDAFKQNSKKPMTDCWEKIEDATNEVKGAEVWIRRRRGELYFKLTDEMIADAH